MQCIILWSAMHCSVLLQAIRTVQVKLWDISDASPKALASQDLGIGAVFTLGVPADAAHLVVAGGAQGEVSVWDLRHHKQVAAALA